MSEIDHEIVPAENWKPKVLITGAVLGALLGLGAAYLMIQNSGDDKPPEISAGEGVKLGVVIMGLLRSVATLGEGK